MRLIPVEVTSAIELSKSTVDDIGKRIGAQTGLHVQLTSTVDPDIIGGIVLRVGNFILDASIRGYASTNYAKKSPAQPDARDPARSPEPHAHADQAPMRSQAS